MVTKQFLTPFYSHTLILSGHDTIAIAPFDENGSIGQIVKADFINCIPGLTFSYAENSKENIVLGGDGNFVFEQPTTSLTIQGKSQLYPEEDIYGTLNYYYWFPTLIPAQSSYIETFIIQNILTPFPTIGFKNIQIYVSNLYKGTNEQDYLVTITFNNNTTESISLYQSGYYELNEAQLAKITTIQIGQALYANVIKENIKEQGGY